tara:strand:+ start:1032 stop:1553 length:522 start_codon:yes stop_codon:yes gene_type:complete
MGVFTNTLYPAGGEAGDGGGIVQVRTFSRSGPLSYSAVNQSTYNCLLYGEITPRTATNKILIFASINGVANRGGGEWESWLGYNTTAPNGTTVTGSDQAVGNWTTINMMTGLGSWGRNDQTIGTDTGNAIHSPNTTNAARYAIITNRKSSIYVNNEWSTNDQGTSLILMEISS